MDYNNPMHIFVFKLIIYIMYTRLKYRILSRQQPKFAKTVNKM